jgi:phage-related protein
VGRTIAISLLATDRMSRTFDRAAASTTRLNGALERVDKVGKMTSLATAAAGAIALTKTLIPLTAAVVALPSAFASLQVVTKTLKVGMTGVGEAMKQVASGDAKKLDAALKSLSPNARAFVKETANLNKEWVKTRKQVQDSLFVGLDKQIKGVAHNLLPTVSLGMKSVATDLNQMGVAAAKVMKTSWFKGRVAIIFKNAGDAVHTMSGAVKPLLNIVTRLAVMGAPLVKVFAGWVVQGLKAASAWMDNSNNATKMTVVIANVRDGLTKLGTIVSNVVTFFGGLVKASSTFNVNGADMLDTLVQLTTAMASWSQSAQGQATLTKLFESLGQVASQLAQILPLLVGPLGLVLKLFNSMPTGVQGTATQMLAWSVVINLIAGRLKLLVGVAGGFKAVKTGIDGIGKGIKGLQAAGTATKGFITGFRNVNTAFSSGATRANTLGAALKSQLQRWRQLAGQMATNSKAAITSAASWVKLKAAAAGQWIAGAAKAVASWATAMYRAAAAATAQAAAAVRQKAAAAGAWIAQAVQGMASYAVATGRATAAATANAVASARQKVAIIATTVASKVAAVASKAWAAAQWLLNAALSANPIGLIIAGIIALGAAFVLAYNKVGWFRNLVNTLFSWFMTAVNFVVNFVKNHWQLLIAIILGPMGIIVGLVIKYWSQIKSFVLAAVNYVVGFVKSHWQLLLAIIGGPLGLAVGLVIKYWGQIKSKINAAIDWVLNFVRSHWKLLVSILGGPLVAAVILVVSKWNSIKNATISVWNSVHSHISSVLGRIKSAFSSAVSGISGIWKKLEGAAKTPVNFVIGIYNSGIRSLVSNLSGLVGHKINLPYVNKFAQGGIMPGYAPGRDSLMAMVSPGESIFRPEFTRAVGSGWVNTANAIARKRGPKAVQSWLTQGGDKLGAEGAQFARGGVAGGGNGFAGQFGFGGIVGGLVKGLKNFSILDPLKAAKNALSKIVGGTVPGNGLIRDQIAKLPKLIQDKVWSWIKSKLDFFGGSGGPIGGGGFARGLQFAKSQSGKPYVWGGVGPGGYDCSGFMSAITNVIHGKNPYSRLFSTRSFGASGGPGGFVRNAISPFRVGVTNAGVGHMAGTLNGVNVESNGSQGVHYGRGARGFNDGLFGYHYGLKADTGALTLQRGWNPPVYNGTGKPELLATPSQGSGDVHLHLDNHGVIGSKVELQNWLTKTLDTLRRQGRLKGIGS